MLSGSALAYLALVVAAMVGFALVLAWATHRTGGKP